MRKYDVVFLAILVVFLLTFLVGAFRSVSRAQGQTSCHPADAHSTADLDLMHYGVTTARRGWAEAADVINTFTPQKFNKWLAAR